MAELQLVDRDLEPSGCRDLGLRQGGRHEVERARLEIAAPDVHRRLRVHHHYLPWTVTRKTHPGL